MTKKLLATAAMIRFGTNSVKIRRTFETQILPLLAEMDEDCVTITNEAKSELGLPLFLKGAAMANINKVRAGYSAIMLAHESGAKRFKKYYEMPTDAQITGGVKGGGGGR